MPTLEILKRLPKSELTKIIHNLNVSGYLSDEDGTALASWHLEKWNTDCTVYLRDFGYKGGVLKCSGKYFKVCGSIYLLFDTDRIKYSVLANLYSRYTVKYVC